MVKQMTVRRVAVLNSSKITEALASQLNMENMVILDLKFQVKQNNFF